MTRRELQLNRTGLTLVELMVVIGIVALLIALLIPLRQDVRHAASTAACLNNQQQIAQAVFAYAQKYSGRLPVATGWSTIQGGTFVGWGRFLTDAQLAENYPSASEAAARGFNTIFFCPAKRQFVGSVRTDYAVNALSDYAFTALAGDCSAGDFEDIPNPWQQMDATRWVEFRSQAGPSAGKWGPYKLDEIKRPTETALLADAHLEYLANPTPRFLSSVVFGDKLENYPGGCSPSRELTDAINRFPLHHGCTNIVFSDGHGETRACPINPASLERMLKID